MLIREKFIRFPFVSNPVSVHWDPTWRATASFSREYEPLAFNDFARASTAYYMALLRTWRAIGW